MPTEPEIKQALDSRLARGELSTDQYRELVQILTGSGATPERQALDLRLARGEIGLAQYMDLIGQLCADDSQAGPPPASVAPLPDAATQRRPGTTIAAKYILIERLGAGGMGEVWKARDTESEVERAIKFLPPEVSRSDKEMRRLRENFRLVYGLIHEGIAAMHGLEQHGAEHVLVLEYVAGQSLRAYARDFLKAHGASAWADEAMRLGLQLARALDFAHAKNVIHRDIKPENIIVMRDGNAKVLDFGLAAEIQSSLLRVSAAPQRAAGTRPYMAPEQWRGQQQDAATDQYALAVVLYELLSGHLPFYERDTAVLRGRVLQEPPAPLPMLANEQNAALLRGLAKTREERFATCTDLVEALTRARQAPAAPAVGTASASQVPTRPSPKPPVAHVGAAVAAMLVGLVCAVSCLIWVNQRARHEAEAAARAAELQQADAAEQARAAERKAGALEAVRQAQEKWKAVEADIARDEETDQQARDAAVARLKEEERRTEDDRKRSAELTQQALTTALNVALDAKQKAEWQQVIAALDDPLRALGAQPHPNRKAAEELLAQARDELRKRALPQEPAEPAAVAKADTPSAPPVPATPEARAAKAMALVDKIRAAAEVLRQTRNAEDDVRRLEAAVKLNERSAEAARADRSKPAGERQALAGAAEDAAAQAQEKLGQAQQRLAGAQREAAGARRTIADAKKEFATLTAGLSEAPLKECQAAFVLALREIPAPDADKALQLAQNCLVNKEQDKARTLLEQIVADYPDSRAADKARKLLAEMKR